MCEQAEEVQVSSEGEMRGVGRTRPAEEAKRKEEENGVQEKENMKAQRICRLRRAADYEDDEERGRGGAS